MEQSTNSNSPDQFAQVDTTRSIARVQGRLSYLLAHRELPPHFNVLLQQSLEDLQLAHESHERTLAHHASTRRELISTVCN